MVDGYDELPDEFKEKIDYALENHHVHDDDWNGVSSRNAATRPCAQPLIIAGP